MDMPLKPNVLEDMARSVSSYFVLHRLVLTFRTGSPLLLLAQSSIPARTPCIWRMSLVACVSLEKLSGRSATVKAAAL